MSKPCINLDDLEYGEMGKGDKFHLSRAEVASRLGATRLGYAVYRIQPGKRAFPYHAHRAIEEMFYVLSGAGTLRHAGEEYPVRAGDFICSPADPSQPHQIINTSDEELTYIAVSNQPDMDIVHYPDSGKFGLWHGDPNDRMAPDNFRLFAHDDVGVDYWEGEEED